MLKIRNMRRTIALAASTLAIAGGATFATTGTAQAASPCSAWDNVGHGWQVRACIYSAGGGGYYSETDASGGDTDVIIYSGILDTCNGVIYNTASAHTWPGDAYTTSNGVLYNSECRLEGVAWINDDNILSYKVYSPTNW